MLSKINKKLLLIILLAILLRSFQITSTPPINPDEAAIGYNAYSLILTNKDEHGNSWPLHFKSFGDFKPGGYFYLVLPFVKLLGLNSLSVRLPNFILSILTIYFLYKLIFLFTKNNKFSSICALVLSISPWHIHFSRGGWESSAALAFIIIGTYYFFKSTKEFKARYFLIFIINYSLSLYTYHSARIIAPLIALSLFIYYFKFLKTNIKKVIIPLMIGILLTLPVVISFMNSGGATRFGGVGLTADLGPINRANELINHHNNVKLVNRIIHNKRLLYTISWAQKYSSHFDLNFLAVNGDEVPRSKTPEMGQIHIFEIPFLLLGIIFLFRKNKRLIIAKDLRFLIIIFLLISPLASSLTFQAPSALRALPMVISLTILISIGLYQLIELINQIKFLKLRLFSFLILSFIYFYSLAYYLDSYYLHYPKRYPFAWQYSFDQLVPYLESQKTNFDQIYITDKYDQPYILFLFFSQFEPQKIQKEIELTPPDKFGFSTVKKYDKYNFQKIDWNQVPNNSLVVTSDEQVPIFPQKIINFPNGQPAFNIFIK